MHVNYLSERITVRLTIGVASVAPLLPPKAPARPETTLPGKKLADDTAEAATPLECTPNDDAAQLDLM